MCTWNTIERLGRAVKIKGKFQIGDRVEVYNIAYQGIGTIVAFSGNLSTGPGTPLVPLYRVEFGDGVLGWVGRAAIKKV